jgi:uncharacterized protein
MDMTGEYLITAPRAKVWSALNDPVILKQCIAGCEELLKTSDTEFAAKVHARVGPVSAHFSGKVTLSELDPPNGYRISGEGSGGAAGCATVHLSDAGAATKLTYKVEAQIGGKLAQIGSRLIDGTARKMADDFFAKFAALVGAPAVAAAPAPAPAAAPSPAQAPAAIVADDRAPHPPTPTELLAHQEGRRMPPILWVTILAALVAGVLYFFVH